MTSEGLTRRSVLGAVAAMALPMGLSSSAGAAVAAGPSLPLSTARVRRVLGEAAPDVSFSVKDRVTGGVFTFNRQMENCTGSIVKVLVLATIIRSRAESGRSLSASQRELATAMIRYSDNDATSSLLRQAGGGNALEDTARALGLKHTHAAGSWGRTATTAEDQRLLIDRLVEGTPVLAKKDRDYILGLMRTVSKEQRWGVGEVPPGGRAAVKNGWVPLSPRGWRVNSIGAVQGAGRDYSLAVLSYDNTSMEQGIARMRAVAGLVWRALAPSSGGTPADQGLPYWVRPGAAVPPHPLV